ncbi:hypothetical protein VTJ49DRAFT_3941 [Mycothermus thermophilus]|uniref:Haloalkanoic acid dehalogenase n=1 Tax=Humicola insolens TaxID=85995 RepID=A0ABR3V6J8_HUMIN
MSPHPDLTTFRALSFDCYGTLIDWEPALAKDLSPLVTHLDPSHPFRTNPLLAIQRFDEISMRLEAENPRMPYPENLSTSFHLLGKELGIDTTNDALTANATSVGHGPSRWPAFPDTVSALARLARRYRLVVLSNVDEASISRATAGPLAGEGFKGFDAIYTAEKIGSYKPDLANFRFLKEAVKKDLGMDAEKGELLHVARSLIADHVPAKEAGLRSVWIARGGDKPKGYGLGGDYERLKAEGKLGFEWMFQTLGEFADEVDRQFKEKARREKGE